MQTTNIVSKGLYSCNIFKTPKYKSIIPWLKFKHNDFGTILSSFSAAFAHYLQYKCLYLYSSTKMTDDGPSLCYVLKNSAISLASLTCFVLLINTSLI